MKQFILTPIFVLLVQVYGYSQTFTHSGKVMTDSSIGISGVTVKLYERTTPTLTGFTSQTNYNGHSYYRSTSSATWTDAKAACENMGGHLVTISNSSENSFVYNTWPSGWIGYYQDKNGAFYSEPNAGWRWTQPYTTSGQIADYEVQNYTTGSTLTDIKSSINATLFNTPTLTSTGGKYLTFNGSTQYAMTGDLSGKFSGGSEVTTLILWVYPTDAGVLVSEKGSASLSSTWHESNIEITNVSGSSGTLRLGLWNTSSAISQISTTIAINRWNMIALTYDGSTMKGYLNGVYFNSITFNRDAPYNNSNGLYYALFSSESTNMGDGTYAAGRLGDFQVYNTALTADEIDRNYMSTAWRFGVYPYSNWNGGEPNNAGSEDYIQFVSGGRWNDLPNNSLPYVLEFDYIVTTSSWSLLTSTTTNSSGAYSFSVSTNPSKEYYIEVVTPTVSTNISTTDLIGIGDVSLQKLPTKSYHYHKFDINLDSKITISDIQYIMDIINGTRSFTKTTLLFTSSQWSSLSSGTSNLKSTIPGITTNYTFTPTSGGTTNFYLLSPGYTNQSKLTY